MPQSFGQRLLTEPSADPRDSACKTEYPQAFPAPVGWRARGIDGECSPVLNLWPICRLEEVVKSNLFA